MRAPTLRTPGTLLIAAALLWVAFGSRVLPRAVTGQPAQDTPAGANAQLLQGTGSCAGCHSGNSSDKEAVVQLAEFPTWREDDRHFQAFQVLGNPRSERILKNLGWGTKAQEEPRCLVCHTNPVLASADPKSPKVSDERGYGVGCEACHGSANKWLEPHTDRNVWRPKSENEKWTQFGMFPVLNALERAKLCVGCHVGSPPTEFQGHQIISRDVNHDLIAAGHPRLNFELGVFGVVTPHHWSAKRDELKPPDHDAKTWALGQLVTALAAAELLQYRASNEKGPWPEFTEYDCFACHHNLRGVSWRQDRGYQWLSERKRMPGSFPWGSWNFALLMNPQTPSGEFPSSVAAPIDALRNLMGSPAPDRKRAAQEASAVVKALAAGVDQLPKNYSRDKLRQLMRELVSDKGQKMAAESWDSAAQVYLALAALHDAYRGVLRAEKADLTPTDRVVTLLQKLAADLEFPKAPDKELYDSPERKFEPFKDNERKPSGTVEKTLEEIARALGS